MRLLVALVLLRFALPLVLLHPAWEYHRDELLYFAMGDHLAWRMQFPPLIAVVARVGDALFGDAVWAARVPAAAAGAALTGVVLWLVRRLGGGSVGMLLAWTALLGAPVFLRPSVLMHPVVFDQLWAMLAVTGVLLAAREREPSWWLLTGAALGLGLLTKMSALMYGAVVLGIALLVPVLRQHLATRWPWLAALLAVTLGVPTLLGQLHFDWPFLAQLSSLQGTQLAATNRLATLVEQPLMLGPLALLVLAGLVAGLRAATTRVSGSEQATAAVATLFATGLLVIVLLQRGKAYYAAPAYPVLAAVGAAWLAPRLSRASSVAFAAVLLVATALLLPLGVPLLAPAPMARYTAWLGVGAATRTNVGEQLPLPQDYADMLGWRAQAEAASQAFRALSPADTADAILAGSNYGRAGAIARYRRRLDLPYPVSVHGDFHAWGVGERSGRVVILLDEASAQAELESVFRDVREVARIGDPRAVAEEQDVRVLVAREPGQPIASLWPMLGPRWD